MGDPGDDSNPDSLITLDSDDDVESGIPLLKVSKPHSVRCAQTPEAPRVSQGEAETERQKQRQKQTEQTQGETETDRNNQSQKQTEVDRGTQKNPKVMPE